MEQGIANPFGHAKRSLPHLSEGFTKGCQKAAPGKRFHVLQDHPWWKLYLLMPNTRSMYICSASGELPHQEGPEFRHAFRMVPEVLSTVLQLT